MGMGYGSNIVDVVEEDFVKEICLEEFNTFVTALEKNEQDKESDIYEAITDIVSFAMIVAYEITISKDANDDETSPYEKTYIDLCLAFEERTGLSLDLGYHDLENDGDRYDDVDGAFWVVGNVYQLTEAGKKYEDKIQKSGYVTFG